MDHVPHSSAPDVVKQQAGKFRFVAFCSSNVKRGQAIQQLGLAESKCGTRASIVLQPKLRALAAGKSPFITSSEDLPRE